MGGYCGSIGRVFLSEGPKVTTVATHSQHSRKFWENSMVRGKHRPGLSRRDRAKVASVGLLLLHHIKLSSITKKECASAKPSTLFLLKLNSFCCFYAFFVSVFYYVHFGHCISDVDDFRFCIAAC